MNTKLNFAENSELPKLSWMAHVRSTGVHLVFGSGIKTYPNGIYEGGWSNTDTPTRAAPEGIYIGSGLFEIDGRIIAVAPYQTAESVFIVMRNGESWVSNSMAFALAGAGVKTHKIQSTVGPYSSLMKGVKDYRRRLFQSEDYSIWRFTCCTVDIESLEETPHVPNYDFQDFESYRDFLLRTIRDVKDTSGATGFASHLSRGYDSVVCAALMSMIDKDGLCLTVRKGRHGFDDDGHEIARQLGLTCHEIAPKERPTYKGKNGILYTKLDESDADDIRYFSVGTNYADIPLKAPEEYLAGRVALTGFLGDMIWDIHSKPSGVLARENVAGNGLYEYRYRAGFVNLPVPYIGALRDASISRISKSADMAPWSIGGRYDRPIARRIGEEAGVDRNAFGQKKTAVSTQNEINRNLRDTLFQSIVDEYSACLESQGIPAKGESGTASIQEGISSGDDDKMIHPILLCGGSGTRLWPLSRKSFPKQFARLMGEESLFQASARRLSGQGFAAPVILTGDPFRFIVTEQLAGIEQAPAAILIEPEGRNTAPAVLAAALWLAKTDPDALMLVAPSDHVIPESQAFCDAVTAAVPRAQAGDLVTFGIAPVRPETGYGYLELAAGADPRANTPQSLARFVEKPDAAEADEMLRAGHYLWNAGIFLFTAGSAIAAYETHAPGLVAGARAALDEAETDLGFTRLAPEPWAGLDDISIDYAIMEKADNLAVMPYGGGWSDLGGWDAVWRETGPDGSGNVTTGPATAIDCTDTLLRSEAAGVELVGIGLEDIVAVATSDAVLVAHKSRAQEVKQAVAALKEKGAAQAVQFPVDHRPWGWFESLVVGNRFQVKRIHVHPGAALSLQSHHHRSEHWIVVEGTAKVTVDDTVRLLTENESVYIPLGAVHRMENPGKVPMVLIEVQTGSYLGEDDIIRYEDVYARS